MTKLLTQPNFLRQTLLIFLLCLITYSNTFGHHFMMDDIILMTEVKRLPFSSIFTHHLNGFYRPLGVVLLKASLISGKTAWPYHALNLGLFVIMAILFLAVLNTLVDVAALGEQHRPLVFLAVILYCVHPINAMIVNYKTAGMLTMVFISMLGSMLAFLKFLQSDKKSFYYLSVFFYVCALLSHEIGSTLPLYLLAVVYFTGAHRRKDEVDLFWPYAVCFVIYLYLLMAMANRFQWLGEIWQVSLPVCAAVISKLLQWYFAKLLIPYDLLFLWDVPVNGENLASSIAWLIAFAGVIIGLYVLLLRFKKRLEVFALSIFLIGFLPLFAAAFVYTFSSQITKPTAMIEPHWFYLSSIGFFVLVASLLRSLTVRFPPLIQGAVMAGAVTVLMVMTWQGNRLWQDGETYCTYWIKLNPYNDSAHSYLMIPESRLKL
jgi:hypothetical protein